MLIPLLQVMLIFCFIVKKNKKINYIKIKIKKFKRYFHIHLIIDNKFF